MGLSRISAHARSNWGRQSVVLDRLTRENFRLALKSAKVLVLATHGEGGYAATYFSPEVLSIWPADIGVRNEVNDLRFLCVGLQGANDQWKSIENVSANREIQLAYIFACHAGKKAAQWKEHLAPARVVTYDRFSTIWDHAVWFAFTGPSEMKTVR
jgi:hypothetical protein